MTQSRDCLSDTRDSETLGHIEYPKGPSDSNLRRYVSDICATINPTCIVIDQINDELRFKSAEFFLLGEDSGYVTLVNRGLRIFIAEPTQLEAIQTCKDELAFIWNKYAKAPDEKLTPKAQELKRRLLKDIRPVKD